VKKQSPPRPSPFTAPYFAEPLALRCAGIGVGPHPSAAGGPDSSSDCPGAKRKKTRVASFWTLSPGELPTAEQRQWSMARDMRGLTYPIVFDGAFSSIPPTSP